MSWIGEPVREGTREGCGLVLVALVVVPLALGLCAYAVRLGWILAAG